MSVIRSACCLLALFLAAVCGTSARAADDFLDPAVAFQVSAKTVGDHALELTYRIAPGYYLYRERFKFESTDARLGEPVIPAGLRKYDSALEQNVEVYHDQVVVTVPVLSGAKSFQLAATHQGCAEKGLCYPPQLKTLDVSLKAFGAAADSIRVVADDGGAGAGSNASVSGPVDGASGRDSGNALRAAILAGTTGPGTAPSQGVASATPAASDDTDGQLASALRGGRLGLIIPLFFLAGLLLSLTPCVLPMVPILSSIIVGQGERVTRWRGFTLALAYALGMALLYTALGVAAGLLGEGLAAWLQKPAVLAAFAILLVVLSLSMFGLYELQLPAALRDGLSSRGDRLRGGHYAGVFAMGGLSALIVSPCVAAPLAAALLHISQTGDAVLGGVALFVLAMGMSVPLLLVGASAGALLPRAGAWMEQVKHVFGLLLLAVAIYTVQPVVPALAAMVAWGVLLLVGAATLGAFEPVPAGAHVAGARALKGLGLVLALLGVLQFVGLASGGRDPAQPLARLALAGTSPDGVPGAGDQPAEAQAGGSAPRFDRVASLAELDQRLQAAGRPVMLDFYADWCVSCKEMESQTFVEPGVRARLGNAVLLRADVTANNDDDRALLKRFKLFGPPGLIFFDAQGRELESARVIGFQDAPRFTRSLAGAGL